MNIILYSTHCPKCNVLTNKLNSKGIQYTEVTDVDEMQKLGLMSVPYLSVDGELLDFAAANKWINRVSTDENKDENPVCASCLL